ncbi:MAG: hypothetical protein DMG06_18345 [Acidobacteria bacterium]|nr:MAG: hypothetical protein DMG06_18345 [Acidobacteriota bacterium]
MQKIDKEELQKRLDQITDLFASLVTHADHQSTWRCPYKNRYDQCTAHFGCRNQLKAGGKGELPLCAGDDKLNYRSAWNTQ